MSHTMNSVKPTTTTTNQPREPPMWFDLSQLDPMQALYDIRCFAKNFAGMKDLDFKNNFDANLISAHYTPYGQCIKPVIIGYIPAPKTHNSDYIIQKVIGHEGYWLKLTTELSGAHFIWYEPSLNNFLFWAPNKFSIVKAMKAIRKRIMKYCDASVADDELMMQMPPPPHPPSNDDDNDDDVPEMISYEEMLARKEEEDEYADMPELVGADNEEYYKDEYRHE